jgi:hypothetical protein
MIWFHCGIFCKKAPNRNILDIFLEEIKQMVLMKILFLYIKKKKGWCDISFEDDVCRLLWAVAFSGEYT